MTSRGLLTVPANFVDIKMLVKASMSIYNESMARKGLQVSPELVPSNKMIRVQQHMSRHRNVNRDPSQVHPVFLHRSRVASYIVERFRRHQDISSANLFISSYQTLCLLEA